MNKKIEGIDIHIGDIVQLEAASKGLDEKIPYMVVLEVVKEKVEGGMRYKYNCVWFIREKIWDFKYTWLSVSPLTVNLLSLATKNPDLDLTELKIGSIVFISSILKEHKIQKDDKGTVTKTATTFTSPALTIIGFENAKNQASTFDSNSNVIREVGNLLAKCLYFNPISNKYSEILLPVDTLTFFQ